MSSDVKEIQYSGPTFAESYAAFKKGTRQSEFAANAIAKRLENTNLGTVLEIGTASGEGTKALFDAFDEYHTTFQTPYLASDISGEILKEAKVRLAGHQVEYLPDLDWTSDVARNLVVKSHGSPSTIISLYNLFLMGADKIGGEKKPDKELQTQKETQEKALQNMMQMATERVIVVQANPQSPLYLLQEKALGFAGRSLNLPIMAPGEIKDIVQSEASAEEEIEVKSNLTLTLDELKKSSLFLLGVQPDEQITYEGKSINLFSRFKQLLEENGYYNNEKNKYEIPILDVVYLIQKSPHS